MHSLRAIAVFALAGLAAGCSAAAYRERADREAYEIVADKQKEALGASRPFSIDPPLTSLRRTLENMPAPAEVQPKVTPPARRLTLEDCLDVAAENNRDLQRRGELVFVSALALTLARFDFENQWFGLVSATGERNHDDVKSASVQSSTGFSRTFATGLRMVTTLGNDFLRIITHPSQRSDTSFLTFALTQPLLRGAGEAVVREPLVQAERNSLYAVRDYERFRQTLAVQVTDGVYRVLQAHDQVENERSNLRNLELARERTESLAEAGRIPVFQVDQAQQDELKARNRVIAAQEAYESAVDDFLVLLGLPPGAPIEVDLGELDRLRARGLSSTTIDAESAVVVGLHSRLDLKNAVEQVDDASRKIVVAENALQAGLDISFTANVQSAGNTVTKPEFNNTQYTANVSLDLPLNRVSERNSYRTALINLEQAHRFADQSEDSVRQEVRAAVRQLEAARQSFDIQTKSVKLAETRIESTALLQQAGRAETRDVLEAQSALVDAQNALTRALVDNRIGRLALLRDAGVLQLEPTGLRYDDSLEPLAHAEP
ncbi:MAG: TolC family protein [Planctomycetes bacterium]|nr:TolC family protein [Planctomycetota bacterium]MBI3845721.1 TolC family protein [Planctomycetota bacterium]